MRWALASLVSALVAQWAWRAMNPRPALLFILILSVLLFICAATASTFGSSRSYWVNQLTKGVPHEREKSQ